MNRKLLPLVAIAIASCRTSVPAPENLDGGATDGSSADGDSGLPDGATIAGDGAGDSGHPTSAGTVTLQLKFAPGAAYCDDAGACQTDVSYIGVRSSSGAMLVPALGSRDFCPAPSCDQCQPMLCPAIACPPRGVAAHDQQVTWDGSYFVMSTCGPANIQCRQPLFAPPGRYVAVMCATPGKLETPAGGVPGQCTRTGERQCIEVSFDYPSATPIVGTLPAASGPSCRGQTCQSDEICVNPCCGGIAPQCRPAPDGGACPSGSFSCIMQPGGQAGCATPCTPPPSFCQPRTTPLPGGCRETTGGQTMCLCA